MIFLTYLSLVVHEIVKYFKPRQEFEAFGEKQSPVDIATVKTEYDANLRKYPIVINYNEEENLELINTGHTVQANISQLSTISEGPLKNTYQLQQFHLHWGSTDEQGSEHTVDGHRYSAELHLVHYNCDKYSSINEAINFPDGLAVIGVFLTIGNEHSGFQPITERLCDVTIPSQCSNVSCKFNPVSLLPENTSDFWTYSGSLTTPPYSETVTWVLFRDPIEISNKQMESLRSLCHSDVVGDVIVDNYRDICPLGNRVIRGSFGETMLNEL